MALTTVKTATNLPLKWARLIPVLDTRRWLLEMGMSILFHTIGYLHTPLATREPITYEQPFVTNAPNVTP